MGGREMRMRLALLVNLRRLARRTDKLDQMSRGLCLPAATHLGIASGFGCFGCMWWLQELGEQQQRNQLFSTLAMVAVVAAAVAGACWLIIDEAERRFCDLGHCGRPCSRCVIFVS